MKFIVLILMLAVCLAATTAQNYPMDTPTSNTASQTTASRISAIIVEAISRAFTFVFELFDIKVRSIRFLASLYTNDNLVLFKKVLSLGLRFGNWLYSVVPDSTTDGQNRFFSLLFPQVNLKDDSEENSQPSDLTLEPNGAPSHKEPPVEGTGNRGDTDDLAGNELYDSYNHDEVMNLRRLIHGGY